MSDFEDTFGEWLIPGAMLAKFTGTGFDGDTWDEPVALNGVMLDHKARLVRSNTGDEKLSQTALYSGADEPLTFSPGDRVTLPGAATPTTVIQVATVHAEGIFSFAIVSLE